MWSPIKGATPPWGLYAPHNLTNFVPSPQGGGNGEQERGVLICRTTVIGLGVPPIILNTPVFRSPTDEMIKRLADLRTPQSDYKVDRSLKECSPFSDCTPLGAVEKNIDLRLHKRKPHETRKPLRILTIGPGIAEMEWELKKNFGSQIEIDTFTLDSTEIPSERMSCFRRIFIGNMDTHKLPKGYDLILSFYGSFHAVDQRNVYEQIVEALKTNGEACFNVPVTFRFPLTCQLAFLRQLGLVSGKRSLSGFGNIFAGYMAYLHKRQPFPDDFSLEQVFADLNGPWNRHAYQIDQGGDWLLLDPELVTHIANEMMTPAFAQDPSLPLKLREYFMKNKTETYYLLFSMLEAGFTLKESVERCLYHPIEKPTYFEMPSSEGPDDLAQFFAS